MFSNISRGLSANNIYDHISSEPFAGRSLLGDFLPWCAETFDLEGIEAAQVLRRALFIGLGRQYDFERIPVAEGFASLAGGACHTFQPGRMETGFRVRGSVRNWTEADAEDMARQSWR